MAAPSETEVFARNLASFRAAEGMTQQDLAEAASISVASVYRYEAGRGLPERSALLRFGEIFGRPVEDFFKDTPPPRDPSRRQPFAVRFKIVGTPPPGLEDELKRVLEKYTPEEAERRRESKAQYRGQGVPPKPKGSARPYKPKKTPDHPPPIGKNREPKK